MSFKLKVGDLVRDPEDKLYKVIDRKIRTVSENFPRENVYYCCRIRKKDMKTPDMRTMAVKTTKEKVGHFIKYRFLECQLILVRRIASEFGKNFIKI